MKTLGSNPIPRPAPLALATLIAALLPLGPGCVPGTIPHVLPTPLNLRPIRETAPLIPYDGLHGDVLRGKVPVYLIWYGKWAAADQNILRDLVKNLGGSPYFRMNQQYSSVSGPVSGDLAFAGDATAPNIYGSDLTEQSIENMVDDAIRANWRAPDYNAVYLVLTAPEIQQHNTRQAARFCVNYCGWHNSFSRLGQPGTIKYAFIGIPSGSCGCWALPNRVTSPNGNPGIDFAASTIAHELTEAVTDPDLRAWHDALFDENADRCAYQYGDATQLITDPAGYSWNVQLGARRFLLQKNWVNASNGYCALEVLASVERREPGPAETGRRFGGACPKDRRPVDGEVANSVERMNGQLPFTPDGVCSKPKLGAQGCDGTYSTADGYKHCFELVPGDLSVGWMPGMPTPPPGSSVPYAIVKASWASGYLQAVAGERKQQDLPANAVVQLVAEGDDPTGVAGVTLSGALTLRCAGQTRTSEILQSDEDQVAGAAEPPARRVLWVLDVASELRGCTSGAVGGPGPSIEVMVSASARNAAGGSQTSGTLELRAPPPTPAPPACISRYTDDSADFAWSCAGKIANMQCEQIREPSDPDSWGDNYFCSTKAGGFVKWSSHGPIAGMRCTAITERAEPAEHGWNDNFLCVPTAQSGGVGSAYYFQWSASGPVPGRKCIRWYEPNDPNSWDDNYLCW